MKLTSMALALPAIALLISCSAHIDTPVPHDNPGTNVPDYATSRMAGTINGQAWNLGQGNAGLNVSNGTKTLNLTFGQGTAGDPCAPIDISGSSGSFVIATVPDQTGETQFSFGAGQMIDLGFMNGSQGLQNDLANGKIRIDAVSDTQVSGHLVAVYDGSNQVNGTFTIPVCNPTHAEAPTVPESN